MRIRRGLAAGAAIGSAVAAGMALESGSPAYAIGPPADGTYVFNQAGVSGAVWNISALCVQPSGTRNVNDYSDPIVFAMNCALNVVATTPANNSRTEHLQNFSARARMSSMLWTFTVSKAEGVACPGGGFGETSETYAFSDENLAGTHTTLHGAVCGLEPDMKKESFSLQLIGPPPSPIERYPLDCNEYAMCF